MDETWRLGLGCLVIVLTVYAVYRRVEVRLTLLLAAFALAGLAGDPRIIIHKFFATFTDEKFVVPICTAMGFAYVVRHTGCDKHLVHLLVRPLTHVRWLLLPGTVCVGFLVNMPIVSQTSTVITIGPVVIPILRAARVSPLTIGAALLLGSSIGGELLNPGAPELRKTIAECRKAAQDLGQSTDGYDTERCLDRILPLDLVCLFTAIGVFWLMSLREPPSTETAGEDHERDFRVDPLKAVIPILPLIFLYLTAQLNLIEIPHDWLEELPRGQAPPGRYETRLIGFAMLLGAAVAGLVVWRRGLDTARVFCEGAGYGFAHIISLIVTANCFGEAIKALGLAQVFGSLVQHDAALLIAAAGAVSVGFAFLCGSGMATVQSLFVFFAEPALRLGLDPTQVGAVMSIGAAAGRTLSPVSAVALMSAKLTDTNVFDLVRRLALPILVGVAAMIGAAILWQHSP